MKLLFLSSDPISLPSLRVLAAGDISSVSVSGVITGTDRKKGRGKKLQRNPVAEAAEGFGLPVLQTEKLTASELENFTPFDMALVFAFGQILSSKILSLAPHRFINLHASPLPLLRGASPIETAIAEGWTETAVCLMQLVREMDAGPVAAKVDIPITSSETGVELRRKVADSCPTLLSLLSGQSLSWKEQNHSEATWCRKITKADGLIDFSMTAKEVVNRARAFAGWPGSSFLLNGELVKAEQIEMNDQTGLPGTILEASHRLIIACQDSSVSIKKIQRPTRKMIPFQDFQNQTPVIEGSRIDFQKSQPLQWSKV
ncbi:MAG: methionyl-tRNA formyltransferase [Verrucomicrobiota bacterium]